MVLAEDYRRDKYPWLVIACDRGRFGLGREAADPEASIRVALRDVRCLAALGMVARA